MTSPTARPVKTWRQDPHVPSATCPVPNGLSRGRSFRRSLSILRSPHPQQRQERPWWILEQRPTGVPGAVPNGTPSRHESRRRPRLPVARDGPKRLETSRERRPRRATSTPSGSVTASGTAPLMTRNPAWAFRINKRPKSTLHGKTSTWRSRVVVIIISIRIGILLVEHSRHAARRRHHVERHHVERFLLLRARARR